jgi:hypothetical protein
MNKHLVISEFLRDVVYEHSIEGCFGYIKGYLSADGIDIKSAKFSIYDVDNNRLIKFAYDENFAPFQILSINDRGGSFVDAASVATMGSGLTVGVVGHHQELALTISMLRHQELNVVVLAAPNEEKETKSFGALDLLREDSPIKNTVLEMRIENFHIPEPEFHMEKEPKPFYHGIASQRRGKFKRKGNK